MVELTKLTEIEILGLTIIGEARGEPVAGQVAVGSVIRNRVYKNHTNYFAECMRPEQFSCWESTDPNYPVITELAQQLLNGQYIQDMYLQQCMYVAEGIVKNKLLDNTHGALNYLTTNLFVSNNRPSWATNVKQATSIGSQTFFSV